MIKPKYLRNIPTFRDGFTSLFNLFGMKHYESTYRSDDEALQEDITLIAQDIRIAMALYDEENENGNLPH